MKQISILTAAVMITISAWAQTPPPGTISSQPQPSTGMTNTGVQSPAATNQFGSSNLSFTNSAGGVYSVDQLAGQLQNLRASIDQTLPALGAFTQTYSNAMGGQSTVSGAISGILSRVLKETNAPGNTASIQATNLLTALQQALTRNAPGTAANPPTAQDLAALLHQLQPVPSLLQRLNVASTTNQFAAPSAPIGTSSGGPTPTGR